MPPRVHSCAARPLAEALTAAFVDFPMAGLSNEAIRRRFAEGYYDDHLTAAHGAAAAAMYKATKSKNPCAPPFEARDDGAADALDADAPLVPAGWTLPSGMRHVSRAVLMKAHTSMHGQAAGRMLLCCMPAPDA